MPAAAVIPAPIAYIKVVAVKTFVVEFVFHTGIVHSIHMGLYITCFVVRTYYRLLIICSVQPISVLLIECCCGPVQLL